MIRGAIFDVDGTLLDSMFVWEDIGANYLRSLGMEPREDLAKTFQSFTMEQAACYYRSQYGVTLSVEEILAGIDGMIAHFYRDQVQAKSGVENFLQQLQSRGIKMCIATATDRHLVEAALSRCGILGYFSEIFTCTSVGHSKKEPHIYRCAHEFLGTPKEETYVFEDAFHAAETAASDGFPVVAVYDPSEKQQKELRALARVFLKDFQQTTAFWNLF